MQERMLENWLTKANERTFQVPFCYSLISRGHTLIHMTRHCAMEMGKDILTIAPDGVPCAFQLKGIEGQRLTLSKWRTDVQAQIIDLTRGEILHPTFEGRGPHRSYLVLNGDLDEETAASIALYNRGCDQDGISHRKINVILKGDLLNYFKELREDFWPYELIDIKSYLEIYLESGRGMLPKEKISLIFEHSLPLYKDGIGESEIKRSVAGLAIICSSLISPYVRERNHLAEFEAWNLYLSAAYALCEKFGKDGRIIEAESLVAKAAMLTSLGRLCDELMENEEAYCGNPIVDKIIRPFRISQLIGLMSAYGLHLEMQGEAHLEKHRVFLRAWIPKNSEEIYFWGDYAWPQVLSSILYLLTIKEESMAKNVMESSLHDIISAINEESKFGFPNAYIQPDEVIGYLVGESEPPAEIMHGHSHSFESIFSLLAFLDLKKFAIAAWPFFTRVYTMQYTTDESFRLSLWKNDKGSYEQRQSPPNNKWSNIVSELSKIKMKNVPNVVNHSLFDGLLFLICHPHRSNTDSVKILLGKFKAYMVDGNRELPIYT